MKVLHVISSLNLGGAEMMLRRLVESNSGSDSEAVVVSLTTLGVIGESLLSRGVSVHTLGMSSPLDFPITLWRLIRLIRRYRPDVVQTWMYHADLIGGLASRLAGSCAVVWGVRSTSIPQGRWSVTYWVVRLCAFGSNFIPDRIICCARSARISHIQLNYAEDKLVIIPNGYDFFAFQFNMETRRAARAQLGINEGNIVVGVVGRFDPLKDFHNFISSAAIVAAENENVHFLMVGRGNEWSNAKLCRWIEGVGLIDRFHLVGQQADVARFLSAMDIFCLSSVREAFPNVVVEAMAMGLPCVVTEAGDAAIILDDEDYVVPVKDSASLANALLKMCRLDPIARKSLGESNAEKVRSRYDIEIIRQKYAAVYNELRRQSL